MSFCIVVLCSFRQVQVVFPTIVTGNMEEHVNKAAEFLPERWLKYSGDSLYRIHPFASLPYGHGARMCLGRRFADLEIQILLAKASPSIASAPCRFAVRYTVALMGRFGFSGHSQLVCNIRYGAVANSHTLQATTARAGCSIVPILETPQTWGPGPREQGGPYIPPGTGFPFRRLLRLAGLRWRYSIPLKTQSQSHITTISRPVRLGTGWRRETGKFEIIRKTRRKLQNFICS
jgi:hypothetical protein